MQMHKCIKSESVGPFIVPPVPQQGGAVASLSWSLSLSVRGCRSSRVPSPVPRPPPPTSGFRAVAVHSCLAHTTSFQAPTIACKGLGLGFSQVKVNVNVNVTKARRRKDAQSLSHTPAALRLPQRIRRIPWASCCTSSHQLLERPQSCSRNASCK